MKFKAPPFDAPLSTTSTVYGNTATDTATGYGNTTTTASSSGSYTYMGGATPSIQLQEEAMSLSHIRSTRPALQIIQTQNGWAVLDGSYDVQGSTMDGFLSRAYVFTDMEQLCSFVTLHYAGMLDKKDTGSMPRPEAAGKAV